MSYDTIKVTLGRETFTILELDLPYCSNTYGNGLTSPVTGTCTANGAKKCYNTRNTTSDCQDTANFTETTQTYKFCSENDFPFGQDFIPCIVGEPQFTSTEIQPDKKFSVRSKVTIRVRDFDYHDRTTDPYYSTRSSVSGTYFGRLLARNTYHQDRLMRIKTGYLSDGYSSGNFNTQLYVIDRIDGPVRDGNNIYYDIQGKDILKWADNSKIQIPTPSDGSLNAAITDADTSLVLASTTTITDYPAGGGVVVIGDEYITYTSRTGSPATTLSGLTRGDYGTTASAHSSGDGVQIAAQFSGNPVAICDELLETYVGIAGDTYIPYDAGLTTPTGTNDEWDDEEDYWFPSVTVTAVIGEPTGATDLLNELCEIFNIDIWWDEEGQKIKLKSNTPPLGNVSVTELNDEYFESGSVSVKHLHEKRLSRVIIRFDKINLADDDKDTNFARHHYEKDTDSESLYGQVRTKIIKTRWLGSTDTSKAQQIAQRYLARFNTTPIEIKFRLDAKDDALKVGSICDISTKYIQNADGTNRETRFQITKKRQVNVAHKHEYTGLTFYFDTRNAFIADNTLTSTSPITDYDAATSAQKDANAFVGPNTGLFSDNGSLYLII